MKENLSKERNNLLHSFEKLLEGPMIFLGFTWLALLIIELVWGLNRTLEYLSLFIWFVFIIDFVIKLILAPSKVQFLKMNWLTAISLVIPALRVLRIVRFVRLLRVTRGVRLFRIVSSINRSMKSLAATMRRRAFGYVLLLTLVVTFAGAAGMYALEKPNPGFEEYGKALWWTAMRVITAGSSAEPLTGEGKALAFLLALFGYTIFGYVTATFATFFIGRDAEEREAPLAGTKDVSELKQSITALIAAVKEIKQKQR
jgi:voltage-gated potassium channel